MGNRPAHGSIEMPSSSSPGGSSNDPKKSFTLGERGIENIHTYKSKMILSLYFYLIAPNIHRQRCRIVETFFKSSV